MSISEVLHGKGHQVVKVRTTDSVETAVGMLSHQRIGAVVVEDQWMRHAGIFSERDFVNAVAEHGAAALAFPVEKLMSAPIVTCRSGDSIDTALAAMTMARIRHLPVVDDGHLVGIISIGDLVKHRLDEKALEANVLLDIARLHA
ncbi:MAG TPA: CBS domain-containing protein [Rhodopila sp.]|jgi:CBS domain-containing protein|nr:CBS domain-containing protein [Rhodopila sp.]